MTKRKGTGIFREKPEPGQASKPLKWLKAMVLLAVISFPVAAVGIVLHNVRSGQTGVEEALFFFIGLGALYVFNLASAGGLLAFLKARQHMNALGVAAEKSGSDATV